jgi:hypothetical protein
VRPVSIQRRPKRSTHISITRPRYNRRSVTVCNDKVTVQPVGGSAMVFLGRGCGSPAHLEGKAPWPR